jgi:hypothetical protein
MGLKLTSSLAGSDARPASGKKLSGKSLRGVTASAAASLFTMLLATTQPDHETVDQRIRA